MLCFHFWISLIGMGAFSFLPVLSAWWSLNSWGHFYPFGISLKLQLASFGKVKLILWQWGNFARCTVPHMYLEISNLCTLGLLKFGNTYILTLYLFLPIALVNVVHHFCSWCWIVPSVLTQVGKSIPSHTYCSPKYCLEQSQQNLWIKII